MLCGIDLRVKLGGNRIVGPIAPWDGPQRHALAPKRTDVGVLLRSCARFLVDATRHGVQGLIRRLLQPGGKILWRGAEQFIPTLVHQLDTGWIEWLPTLGIRQ